MKNIIALVFVWFFLVCFLPCLSCAHAGKQDFFQESIGSDIVYFPKLVNFIEVSKDKTVSTIVNALVPKETKLLAFYVSENVFNQYTVTKNIPPPYIYMLTPKRIENEKLSRESFEMAKKTIRDIIARNGSMSQSVNNYLDAHKDALKQRGVGLSVSNAEFSVCTLISESEKEISYLMKSKVGLLKEDDLLKFDFVSVVTCINIHGKTIYVNVCLPDEDESSTKTAKLIASSVNIIMFKLNGINP